MGKNEQSYAGNHSVKLLFLLLPLVLLIVLLGSCASLQGSLFMEDPLTAEEHNNLGVIYEREGKNDLAIREYKKAISSDSSLVTPLVNLGNVYLKQGEFTESEKSYMNALELDETNLEAANNLASLYIETGENYKDGLRYMGQATEGLESIPPYALDTIGVLHLRLGQKEEAEKFLVQACEKVENNENLTAEIRANLWQLGINRSCGAEN